MSIQSDANFLGGGFPFGGGFGGGFGGNNGIGAIGLIGLNSFLGDRGRDCDKDDGGILSTILGANILEGLGDIKGSIPLVSATVENALLTQTAGLTSSINTAGLANLAATNGVKDTVQNSTTALLLNANSNTNSIVAAITAIGDKIDQNTITDLQTQLLRAESHGRSRETEVNITNTLTATQIQAQAQAQAQAQFGQITSLLTHLFNDIQSVKQGQTVVNTGLMGAANNTATANNVKTA